MKKKSNKLTDSLIETAKDMQKIGLIDEVSYQKITMRLLKKKKPPKISPMTSEDIRAIREREHLSQAVFANYLNLTVGYISQLERGVKHPTGATLTLLHVIRRKGLDAILP
jgi:putative transcriptional regulator